MANVKFYTGTKEQYLSLASHNPLALYFCDDTGELFKGDILLSDGVRIVPTRADLPECNCAADGVVYYIADTKNGYMLSPDRTEWLQTIYAPVTDVSIIPEGEEYNVVTTVGAVRDIEKKIYERIEEISVGGGLSNLTAIDGTMRIVDVEDGGKSIGVAISSKEGNTLTSVDGGLFVPTVPIPEYVIEKQEVAEDGYSVSYRLKKTIGEEVSYVGDAINIAKDLMLQSATLETVTEVDVPYVGAVIGDPYIKMIFNNADASNLYIPVKGLVDTYIAGNGIEIVDNKISVKLADIAHGLVAVDGALTLNLATKDSDGAMSKEDKRILDAIPDIYVSRKYEIISKPYGTLVDYRDKEIRIMCPFDTEWTLQNSGEGADINSYYIGFKAYAPDGAISFKEDLAEIITDNTMYYFENNKFAGVDAQGRHYSIVWLPVAKNTDDTWTYYGVNSTTNKYIGWYYSVEWYDDNATKIGSDLIRINLSNEDCHGNIKPFYGVEYDTSEQIASIEETVAEIQQSYSWGEME